MKKRKTSAGRSERKKICLQNERVFESSSSTGCFQSIRTRRALCSECQRALLSDSARGLHAGLHVQEFFFSRVMIT